MASALSSLGLSVSPLPRLSTAAAIKASGRAQAAMTLRPGEGGYLLQGLAESFNTKAIYADPPIGLAATRRFLAAAAEAFGREAPSQSPAESEALAAAALSPAAGARFLLSADLGTAASLAEAVRELGGRVGAVSAPSAARSDLADLNRLTEAAEPEAVITIGSEQSFEIANILSKSRFDFVLGSPSLASAARSFGAVHLCSWRTAFMGYGGLTKLSRILLASRAMDRRNHPPLNFYKPGWLSKSGAWHVKLETA
jgi:nitrogenase molybdenum-iron protein alpha/beta subunit